MLREDSISTYTQILYHIVFSTKDRAPCLDDDNRPNLFRDIWGIINNHHCNFACISYFTIELKEEIPSEWKGKTEDWVFGCDTCQDVCPWNRFAKPHMEKRFSIRPEIC